MAVLATVVFTVMSGMVDNSRDKVDRDTGGKIARAIKTYIIESNDKELYLTTASTRVTAWHTDATTDDDLMKLIVEGITIPENPGDARNPGQYGPYMDLDDVAKFKSSKNKGWTISIITNTTSGIPEVTVSPNQSTSTTPCSAAITTPLQTTAVTTPSELD